MTMAEKYPKPQRQQRMTVSLPKSLADYVRAEAKEHGVPMSAVIERALRLRRDEVAL